MGEGGDDPGTHPMARNPSAKLSTAISTYAWVLLMANASAAMTAVRGRHRPFVRKTWARGLLRWPIQ